MFEATSSTHKFQPISSLQPSQMLLTPPPNNNYYMKHVSINSNDRNTIQYPNSSEFEIEMAESLENISEIRIIDAQFPPILYPFSDYHENTHLIVIRSNTETHITIDSGYYTLQTLKEKLNTKLTPFDILVMYDDITQQITFYSTESFSFKGDGLLNRLGINPQNANSILTTINHYQSYAITSEFPVDTEQINTIYIELNGQNCIDEWLPFNQSNRTTKTPQTNGVVNSAMRKIHLNDVNPVPYNIIPYKKYSPPAERMRKLKIKIRYHDGKLVPFGNKPYNLTIEFKLIQPSFKG